MPLEVLHMLDGDRQRAKTAHWWETGQFSGCSFAHLTLDSVTYAEAELVRINPTVQSLEPCDWWDNAVLKYKYRLDNTRQAAAAFKVAYI